MNFEKNTGNAGEQDPTSVESQGAPEASQGGRAIDEYLFFTGHVPDSLTQPLENIPEEEV